MKLKNKVVVITGASRGLGYELAKKFSEKGCKLSLCATSLKDLKKVKKELKKCIITKADVSKTKDVKKLFKKTMKEYGQIDILVNNAGINIKKPFYEYSKSDIEEVFSVNTMGVMLCTIEASEHMKSGIVATISSVAAWFGAKNYSVYSASKHAVDGFMKSVKKNVHRKIKIKTYHPYRLKTSLHKDYKIKSPESHMIPARWYAQYIVADIEGNWAMKFLFAARNYIAWLVSLFR